MSLTNYYDIALFGKAETNLKTYGNKYIFHTYPPFSFETYYQELQNVYLTGSSESELVLIEYRTRVLTNLVTGNTSNIFVSGASVNCGNNIVTFTNTSGGTFDVDLSCLLTNSTFTGGTVSGFTTFLNGISSSTISADTYYGDASNLTGIVLQKTGITVSSMSWSLIGSFYEYEIMDNDITEDFVVDVIPNNSDYTSVIDSLILPQTISFSGKVKIFAINQPLVDIGVTVNIFK